MPLIPAFGRLRPAWTSTEIVFQNNGFRARPGTRQWCWGIVAELVSRPLKWNTRTSGQRGHPLTFHSVQMASAQKATPSVLCAKGGVLVWMYQAMASG